MFLTFEDAHSKWPEVIPMTTTSSARTIEELRKVFPTHGLPEQLVSEDGTQFTADELITITITVTVTITITITIWQTFKKISF